VSSVDLNADVGETAGGDGGDEVLLDLVTSASVACGVHAGDHVAGDGLGLSATGIASRGMVSGAVQVPPDGGPVALLCDHATVGGYPVVATVIGADLGVLGQCRPGDEVRFEPVDLTEADRARAAAKRSLEHAVVGWYPVRSD
jgi:hypothetical protein